MVSDDESDDDITAKMHHMQTDVTPSFQMYMSNNPLDDIIEVHISTICDLNTLSLVITTNASIGDPRS